MRPPMMEATASRILASASSARCSRERWLPHALAFAIILALTAASPSVRAQTFTLLHTFPNPGYPSGTIIEVGGTLYGTTFYGGRGFGTVFKLDPSSGNQTELHAFTAVADGEYPAGGLVSD